MKILNPILFFVILIYSNPVKAQCTNPPQITSTFAQTERQCGNNFNLRWSIKTSNQTNQKYFELYDADDTLFNTPLFQDSSYNNAYTTVYNFNTPEHAIAKFYAINDCGISEIIYKPINLKQIKPTLLDSTCTLASPLITGPNQICSNNSEVTFTFNLKDVFHIHQNIDSLYWEIEDTEGGKAYYYCSTNNIKADGTIDLTLKNNQIPKSNFTVSFNDSYLYMCLCNSDFETFNRPYYRQPYDIKFVELLVNDSCGSSIEINSMYTDNNDCNNIVDYYPNCIFKINEDYVITDNNGTFRRNFNSGTFEINAAQTDLDLCDDTNTHLVIDNNTTHHEVNYSVKILEQNPLMSLFVSRARVTKSGDIKIQIKNKGTSILDGQLTLFLPGNNTYTHDEQPEFNNKTENTLIWNNINLGMFEQKEFKLRHYIDEQYNMGDSLLYKAVLNIGNKSYTDSIYVVVTNSYDPNEVIVNKKEIERTEAQKRLKYTVHFQNTGNDTAYTVRVIDSLDANLDMTTLEVAGSSHNYEFDLLPNRTMQWTFNNINLLDSASNEEQSKGWFQFFVSFKNDIQVNVIAESTAHIYFDSNEAIITNTAKSVITNTVNILKLPHQIAFTVYPNPATSELHVKSTHNNLVYEIISIDGRVITSKTHINGGQNTIDISNLKNGIYYIRVIDTNGYKGVKAFKKM